LVDKAPNLCENHNPEWWTDYTKETIPTAIAICNKCLNKKECLEEGIRFEDVWTIRGGVHPQKMRALVREHKKYMNNQ
jgi:hypothetical protein